MVVDTVILFNPDAENYARSLAAHWKNRKAACCRVPDAGAGVVFGEHVLLAGVVSAQGAGTRLDDRLAQFLAERVGSSILIALPGAHPSQRIAQANVPVIAIGGDPIADGEKLDVALRELDRDAIFSSGGANWRRSSLSRLRTPQEVGDALAASREERRRREELEEEAEFIQRDLEASSAAVIAPKQHRSARILGMLLGAVLGLSLLAGAIWWAYTVLRTSS